MDNSSPPINYYKNLANLSCEMNSGNRGNLSGWKNHCAISEFAFIYITMFFTLTKKWIIGLLRRRLVNTWKAFDDSEKNLIVILWNEISTSTRALTFAFFRVRVNWFSNSRTLSILFHFVPFYKFTKEQRNGTNSRIDLTINQTYYCHCQI